VLRRSTERGRRDSAPRWTSPPWPAPILSANPSASRRTHSLCG